MFQPQVPDMGHDLLGTGAAEFFPDAVDLPLDGIHADDPDLADLPGVEPLQQIADQFPLGRRSREYSRSMTSWVWALMIGVPA